MYPFLRLAKEFVKFRNAPPLKVGEAHISHHICWPWDIDMWLELNNGRTLTLTDLGGLPMAQRNGLIGLLRREGWQSTMAGASVRWRARIRPFERFELRSRALGWDDKFLYLDISMWKRDGRCANQVLYRMAVTNRAGLVRMDRVIAALGGEVQSPDLPAWVLAWAEADADRPWPPESPEEPQDPGNKDARNKDACT